MQIWVVALAGVLLSTHPARAQTPAKSDAWQHLETWIAAIERHQPGGEDEALRAVVALRSDELEACFEYLVFTLDAAFGSAERRDFDELFRRYAGRKFTAADQDVLRSLARRLTAGGLDRFLKRAAMLHADIAILSPESHVTSRAGTGHLVSDGTAAGDEGRPWHWILGRALLHLVRKPEEDPEVRLWYQAAGNHLWRIRNYTELQPHVSRAAQVFPRDPEMQFLRGAMHEAQSAPYIQAALDVRRATFTGTMRTVYELSVRSPASERAAAVSAFRGALESDPDYHEARIRLGHVLSLDGKHDQAAIELRTVLAKISDRRLRYFAQLFLGRAEESRGRLDEARAAYREAAALFPSAQSPRLALSQIAFQAGDRDAAMLGLAVLTEPFDEESDPWWTYHYERGPAGTVWLDRLRAAVAEVPR